ncbi:hypothetical protein FACS1894105_12810 [Clostridia bacterium]|nr:hypothetical protein FACS1894105_12810 [Clostridia bacterium]
MADLSLYSVTYRDLTSDFSGVIARSVLAVGKDENDAIQNAKKEAEKDSRDFKANKIKAVMGMTISVAAPEAIHGEQFAEDAPPIVAFGERPSPYRDGYYSDGPREDDPINGAPDFPISVFVENGEHPEFGGFTMPLPATREALQSFLCGLEVTSEAQIAVTDVTSSINGLAVAIASGTGLRLDELNYLAAKLQDMGDIEREVFAAVIAAARHTGSVAEIINITVNLSNFKEADLQNTEEH